MVDEKIWQADRAIWAKACDANKILQSCVGQKGVWASPTRYRHQCWTRDFVIAMEDVFLSFGRADIVERHLDELAKRQYPDGRIPIMFLDDHLKWLAGKVWASIKNRRLSFLLKQYFSRDGIGQLSPWTKDSELLYILGVSKYLEHLKKPADYDAPYLEPFPLDKPRMFWEAHELHVSRALDHIFGKFTRDGLVFGGDWRDTRIDLDDKFLLTNNCLLANAYRGLGYDGLFTAASSQINYRFWTGEYYRDYLGVDDFDTLGNALAILFDIAPRDRWDSIIATAEKHDTPYGYKVNGVTLPAKTGEEERVMRATNQFGVVWPFIHGFMTLAAIKAGKLDIAHRQMDKWVALPGFYEFYDPITGQGMGSADQVWSAALFIRVAQTIPTRSLD